MNRKNNYCEPSKGTKPGTFHVLLSSSKQETVFEWTGKTWSTPNTGFGTKPTYMYSLGWRYLRPDLE